MWVMGDTECEVGAVSENRLEKNPAFRRIIQSISKGGNGRVRAVVNGFGPFFIAQANAIGVGATREIAGQKVEFVHIQNSLCLQHSE